MVYEDCSTGNLESILESKGSLTNNQIQIYSKQIINAIKTCHDFGFAHCDITPYNFLFDCNKILKLIGFKYSTRLNDHRYDENAFLFIISRFLFSLVILISTK